MNIDREFLLLDAGKPPSTVHYLTIEISPKLLHIIIIIIILLYNGLLYLYM